MSYTRLFAIITLLVLMLGCSTPQSDSFTLSGKINGSSNGTIALHKIIDLQLQEYKEIAEFSTDANGQFSQTFELEPHLYQILIDGQRIPLALDHGQHVRIQSGPDNTIEVSGSPDTDLITAYEALRLRSLDSLVSTVRRLVKEERDAGNDLKRIVELRELEVANYQVHLEELMAFVAAHMTSSLALYWSSLRWDGKEHLSMLNEAVRSLESAYTGTTIIRLLKQQLVALEQTSEGGTIPDISLPDLSGDQIRLSEVNQKLTLVDLWASWCGPCRTESQLLRELYQEYGSSGFEIYGISMDTRRQRWEDALEMDGRIWPNVSSLNGLRSTEAKQLRASALPTNFLIDSQGTILARDVHGDKLVDLVSEYFDD